jgi:hypothetical protein
MLLLSLKLSHALITTLCDSKHIQLFQLHSHATPTLSISNNVEPVISKEHYEAVSTTKTVAFIADQRPPKANSFLQGNFIPKGQMEVEL